MRRDARGFTLLEMMVASAISILVLAGALWSAAELQRRGTMEESLMDAQNALRVARELLESEIQRAGAGMGSAPLVFGQRASVDDIRYAVVVGTNEPFDGTGLFAADTTFKPPPKTYGTRMSDAVQLWSWDTEAFDPASGSPVLTPLVICAQDGSTTMYRAADKLCVVASAGDLVGRTLMVIKPSTRKACVMTVTSEDASKLGGYVVLGVSAKWPGAGETFTPSGPCISSASPISAEYTNFWTYDQDNPVYVVPLRGVMFRVNWASGGPVFERQEFTSTAAATTPKWVALSEDVDLIKLRLGVVNDVSNPADPLQDVMWFPDTTTVPAHPTVDSCPKGTGTSCDALVPVNPADPTKYPWKASPTEFDARDALMRRTRMVELRVTTRTTKPDSTIAVKMTGSTYSLDSDGNPIDGYKRRTSTLEVMLRNFDYAGVTQ